MRESGILLPLFSLPSPYGIGTLGQSAYDFIDFLEKSRQRYWQILPLGPTSYGDSPYQSFSTFAGNPYFIDLDLLAQDGLLTPAELAALPDPRANQPIDYALLFLTRMPLLKKAHSRFIDHEKLEAFKQKHAAWLTDYALFMALKVENRHASFAQWPEPLKKRDARALADAEQRLDDSISFYMFLQYVFYKQFKKLKNYAQKKGIALIGDIPIYVAMDSADTWVHPELFMLDDDLTPTLVAGCPPDYFSATGQLWGNPLYHWPAHENEGFAWWTRRVRAAFDWFDVLRIDHFRGFASYYAIPYGDPTAEHGHWEEGPGMKLFKVLKKKIRKMNIIAEDLGYQTPDVQKLLTQTGFPGMKVLQFGCEPYQNSEHLPHNYRVHSVVYTGTHDNATSAGYYAAAGKKERQFAKKYLALSSSEGIGMGFIRGVWSSAAQTAIAPMADFLNLDDGARINIPSTLGLNWRWRLSGDECTPTLAKKIAELTLRYGRNQL